MKGASAWSRGQEFVMATLCEEPEPTQYPLVVDYCGVCGMPPEYCEYSVDPPKCYAWMQVHLPSYYARIVDKTADQLEQLSTGAKKQSRGGKALKKAKKKELARSIKVSVEQRSKRKCVTVIIGLRTCDIDLKVATKAFSSHFSCGSSVTGDDEVVIQGDVCDNLIDFIPRHWPEVEEECIERVVTKKSKK